MMTTDSTFSFQITPAELHWLAGAFAVRRLSLADDPMRSLNESEKRAQIAHGLASLRQRGLVVGAPPAEWQVDRLPGTVILWMAAADTLTQVKLHKRDGSSCMASLYAAKDSGMKLALDGDAYQVTLFADRESMLAHLLDWFGASFSGPEPATVKYTIIQPTTILTAAWNDAALTAKMLKVTGHDAEQIRSTTDWATSLDWLAELRLIQLDDDDPAARKQMILCGNNHRTWQGSLGPLAEEAVTFLPASVQETHMTLNELL